VSGNKMGNSVIETQSIVVQLEEKGFFLAREQVVCPQTV
jgi:hypothetical protein